MSRWMGLAAALLLAVAATTGQAAETLKIAFAYCCPVGDLGWSHEHDQGRLAVAEASRG